MQKLLVLYFVIVYSFAVNAQIQLRVMSYNIRYDNSKDGVNLWRLRKGRLLRTVKQFSPDILGMQEVLHNQFCYLDRRLRGYEGIGVGRDDGKRKGEYAPIFFRKKIFRKINEGYFWLSETPGMPGSRGWDASNVRMASWIQLQHKSTGRYLYVFNTHFDHIGRTARRESAKLITDFIRRIAGTEQVILTGDLNTKPDEEAYQMLLASGSGLLNDVAAGSTEATFCGFEVNSTACIRIDYILTSSGMKAFSYAVICDNNGVSYPSDHRPVVAEIAY